MINHPLFLLKYLGLNDKLYSHPSHRARAWGANAFVISPDRQLTSVLAQAADSASESMYLEPKIGLCIL